MKFACFTQAFKLVIQPVDETKPVRDSFPTLSLPGGESVIPTGVQAEGLVSISGSIEANHTIWTFGTAFLALQAAHTTGN